MTLQTLWTLTDDAPCAHKGVSMNKKLITFRKYVLYATLALFDQNVI